MIQNSNTNCMIGSAMNMVFNDLFIKQTYIYNFTRYIMGFTSNEIMQIMLDNRNKNMGCVSKVEQIDVPSVVETDFANNCGRPIEYSKASLVNCSSIFFYTRFLTNFVQLPLYKDCDFGGFNTKLVDTKRKLIADLINRLPSYLVNSIYDSVYTCGNLDSGITYDKWSAKGSLIDASTTGVTRATVLELVRLMGSQSPSALLDTDMVLYLDQTNFDKLMEDYKTIFTFNCCSVTDSFLTAMGNRIESTNLYLLPDRKAYVMVLPDSFFKKDSGGKPILFAIQRGGFHFGMHNVSSVIPGITSQFQLQTFNLIDGVNVDLLTSGVGISGEPGVYLKYYMGITGVKPRKELIQFIKGI